MSVMDDYKSKLGLVSEAPQTENRIRSEKRYKTVLQYIHAINYKKIQKFIGSHTGTIKDPKESYNEAKKDLLQKCQLAEKDSVITVIVIEQLWATVKATTNLLSTEEYLFQPISSRYLTWEEIKTMCMTENGQQRDSNLEEDA